MNVRCAVVLHGAQIIAFQQAELLQEDRSLAPGAALEHLVAPVPAGRWRLHPGGKGCQILQIEESALTLCKSGYLPGDVAAIKRLPGGLQSGHSTLRDGSTLSVQEERERLSQIGVPPYLS